MRTARHIGPSLGSPQPVAIRRGQAELTSDLPPVHALLTIQLDRSAPCAQNKAQNVALHVEHVAHVE
jgi:hypothetical protein